MKNVYYRSRRKGSEGQKVWHEQLSGHESGDTVSGPLNVEIVEDSSGDFEGPVDISPVSAEVEQLIMARTVDDLVRGGVYICTSAARIEDKNPDFPRGSLDPFVVSYRNFREATFVGQNNTGEEVCYVFGIGERQVWMSEQEVVRTGMVSQERE